MPGALDLKKAIACFGADAKAKLSNPGATGEPEDQLRAPLERLFADLAERCGIKREWLAAVGESSLSTLKTRPDDAITLRNVLVGFIEIKAPGKGADPRRYKGHDKEQWEKLQSLPNPLYTDGNRAEVKKGFSPRMHICRPFHQAALCPGVASRIIVQKRRTGSRSPAANITRISFQKRVSFTNQCSYSSGRS